MNVIETERLLLRKATLQDAAFILELVNDAAFVRNIGDRGVRTIADAEKYIQIRMIEPYERLGYGMYIVELKGEAIPIGICGLVKRDTLPDTDIGFAFLPQYWSKGYAIESARAVLTHAKNDVGLKRILGITSPTNEASIRILEELGLKFVRMVITSADGPESKLFAIDM